MLMWTKTLQDNDGKNFGYERKKLKREHRFWLAQSIKTHRVTSSFNFCCRAQSKTTFTCHTPNLSDHVKRVAKREAAARDSCELEMMYHHFEDQVNACLQLKILTTFLCSGLYNWGVKIKTEAEVIEIISDIKPNSRGQHKYWWWWGLYWICAG